MAHFSSRRDSESIISNLVQSLFLKNSPKYSYHNFDHTLSVVKHVVELGTYYNLDNESFSSLKVAAWFHDVGHLYGDAYMHEERSVNILQTHADTLGIPSSDLRVASELILVTKLGSQPKNLSQRIICDADTWHFGTNDFLKTDHAIRQEVEFRSGRIIHNWYLKTLTLLTEHQYYTDYCQLLLSEGKRHNMNWIREQIVLNKEG